MKYGRWTLLREAKVRSGTQPRRAAIVLCDCGTERVVNLYSLTSGRSISCGCHRVEQQTSHGMAKSAVYSRWLSIKRRCTEPNDNGWPEYGGRGIRLCERWLEFAAFIEDMGMPPDGSLIDRIDGNGNYEPSNCRWASPGESGQNRRKRGAKSLFVGVRPANQGQTWQARIKHGGKEHHLGCHRTQIEAALAYNAAAAALYGPLAHLNTINEG